MVALHQAVLSLKTNEAGMALVCGANLILNPDMVSTLFTIEKCNPYRLHKALSGGRGSLSRFINPT